MHSQITSLLSVATAAFIFSNHSTHAGYYSLESGKVAASFSVTHTSFDQFWAGDVEQPGIPGGDDIERLSYRAYIDYGLTDSITADLSLGYADVDANLGDQTAFADILLGLRWQFLEETTSMPDAVFRLGATLQGDYDVGQLSAPGDGADGIDLSLKAGKTLTDWGLRGELSTGYSFKSEDVPDNYWYKILGMVPVGHGISLDAAFIYAEGVDGIDIGGPGFTGLADLPKVEEEANIIEVGVAWDSGDYGYYRLAYSEIVDGRNIGEESTIGFSASFKF